jgi:hypothetical protein
MADSTRRFGLTILDSPTDQLDLSNYKFSEADRVLLDRLLRVAVEDHVHTGTGISVTTPDAPVLCVQPTGGAIPPNAPVYYRYSIIDSRSQETIASAVASVNTPVPATMPAYAPRLSIYSGYLEAGEYLYAVSACTRESSLETVVGPTASGTLTTFGGWYLDLPPMPTGGEFFNVYRKGPRDYELIHLTTLLPDDRYFVDSGDLRANRLRVSPHANTTNRTNSIEVELPGPFPNDSWTWKLFRTYDPANWEQSLLDWNGPDPHYTDDGRATRPGFPPATTAAVGGAPKINIATDTVGHAPSTISAVTRTVNFNAAHAVIGPGTWSWVCEYEHAELQSIWATVNRSLPATLGDCEIGLDYARAGTDTWQPVGVPDFPLNSVIRVGESIGERTNLVVQSPSPPYLTRGDKLRLHVYETGFDLLAEDPHDLTLTATLRVHDGLSDQSYVWETS